MEDPAGAIVFVTLVARLEPVAAAMPLYLLGVSALLIGHAGPAVEAHVSEVHWGSCSQGKWLIIFLVIYVEFRLL